MNVYFNIMMIHWLADFVLQTHEQASQKSTSEKALLRHVSTYSFVWLWGSWMLIGSFPLAFVFTGFTFFSHYITDHVTSRLVKAEFENDNYHDGFVIIGADQLLHYLQLFLTYNYLISIK